ncbi:hypothetical protein ABT391_36820 [Streptomyces jumonjinensis]|uniref:hypothetical protein n=1 Tax=Streptomyces jumonjinensis TaxID=1945 RepID=UPI003322B750
MSQIDPIHFSSGPDARLGGLDITISLTHAQQKALGADSGNMADWLHTAFWAMAVLRTGRNSQGEPYIAGPDDWFGAITALEHRLLPRLQGVRDAVVRAHADSGGSIGDLSLAMDVVRSTAQYRREALMKARPTGWETWAVDGGPEDKPARPEDVADAQGNDDN